MNRMNSFLGAPLIVVSMIALFCCTPEKQVSLQSTRVSSNALLNSPKNVSSAKETDVDSAATKQLAQAADFGDIRRGGPPSPELLARLDQWSHIVDNYRANCDLGRLEEAEAVMSDALRNASFAEFHDRARQYIGVALVKQGRFAEANTVFPETQHIVGNAETAKLVSLCVAGRIDEAELLLHEVLTSDDMERRHVQEQRLPGFSSEIGVRFWSNLLFLERFPVGHTEREVPMPRWVELAIQRMLPAVAQYPGAALKIAFYLEKHGRYDELRQMIRPILVREVDSGTVPTSQGFYGAAYHWYRRGASHFPENPDDLRLTPDYLKRNPYIQR